MTKMSEATILNELLKRGMVKSDTTGETFSSIEEVSKYFSVPFKKAFSFIVSTKELHVESRWSTFGWGNGYIVLPKDHILTGKSTSFLNNILSVNGGITYSESAKDSRYLLNIAYNLRGTLNCVPGDYWVIGFDTGHGGDDMSWDLNRVFMETQYLLHQVNQLEDQNKLGTFKIISLVCPQTGDTIEFPLGQDEIINLCKQLGVNYEFNSN